MKLKLLIFAAISLSILTANAQQDTTFYFNRSIKGDITDFLVDNLGNIYILNSGDQLKKLGPTADSMAVYNEVRRYGKIYSVDVTNPLKILLYYREFATIVVVDRFLNIRTTIDLRKLNIFQSKAIGLAYDNNIWVYDELEAKLKHIGDDGTLIDQTADVRQLADSVPDPMTLIDQGGYVYLYDTAKGVFVFDHYGAFKNRIQLSGWKDFTIIDKNLFGRNEHFFLKYLPGNPNIQQQPIPSSYLNANKILVTPGFLYVLKNGELQIYSHH